MFSSVPSRTRSAGVSLVVLVLLVLAVLVTLGAVGGVADDSQASSPSTVADSAPSQPPQASIGSSYGATDTDVALAAQSTAPVTLMEDQTQYANSSSNITVTWQVENVTNLTVGFNGSTFANESATNLSIDGNASWDYGETKTYTQTGQFEINVSVDAEAGYFGAIGLDFTFENDSQTLSRSTGPTNVHDNPVSVPEHVDPGSLQQVIDFVEPGTTVELDDGNTYEEQTNVSVGNDQAALHVDKELSITAASGATPTINVTDTTGSQQTAHGLIVQGSDTQLSGVTIQAGASDNAVTILANGVVVQNNTVLDATTAVLAADGDDLAIRDNDVDYALLGVDVDDSILGTAVNVSEISNNTIGAGSTIPRPIHVNSSAGGNVTAIEDNTLDATLNFNVDPWGIWLDQGVATNVSNNTVATEGGAERGILITDGSAASIDRNDVTTTTNGAVGIEVWGPSAAATTVSNNTVATPSDTSPAINVGTGGSVQSILDNALNTTGDQSAGINVNAGTATTVDGNVVNTTGTGAVGVNAEGASTAIENVTNNTVVTNGDATAGVHVANGAQVDSVGSNDVSTVNDSSAAVVVDNATVTGGVDDNAVTAEGQASIGILLQGGDTSVASVGRNTVGTEGTTAPAIYVQDDLTVSAIHNNTAATNASGSIPIDVDDGPTVSTIANNTARGQADGSLSHGIDVHNATATEILRNDVAGVNKTIVVNGGASVGDLHGNTLASTGNAEAIHVHTAGTSLTNVTANDVTVGNATTADVGDGLFVGWYAATELVADNEIAGAREAIYMDSKVQSAVVRNNTVTDSENGIWAQHVADELRENRVIDSNGTGVIVNNATDAIVANTTIDGTSNNDGIHVLGGSENVTLTDNEINDTARYGLVGEGDDLVVEGNVVGNTSDAGIELSKSTPNATVTDNVVTDAGNHGIAANDDVTISGNDVQNVTAVGIYALESYDHQVTDNTVIGTGSSGVALENSSSGAVVNNTIDDTGGAALYVVDATVSAVEDNTVTTSDYGIALDGGAVSVTTVANNTVETNGTNREGVLVRNDASASAIRNNTVTVHQSTSSVIQLMNGARVGVVQANDVIANATGSAGINVEHATTDVDAVTDNTVELTQGDSAGIRLVENASLPTIANNTVIDGGASSAALYFRNATDTVASNNTLVDAQQGIVVGDSGNASQNVTVLDTTVENVDAVVVVGEGSTDVTVDTLGVATQSSFDATVHLLDVEPGEATLHDVTFVDGTTIDGSGENVTIAENATPPAGAPPGRANVSAFLEMNSVGSDSLADVDLHYDEAELAGRNESSLRLFRHDGADWVAVNETGVNSTANVVTANATTFSTFGAFVNESGTLDGTVTDGASGSAVDGATVSVLDDGTEVANATTDGAGDYAVDVADGTYDVQIAVDGYETQTVPDVSVAPNATTTEDVALTGSATITGTVTDAGNGDAIENATVGATGGLGPYTVDTDANGDFTLTVRGNDTSYDVGADAPGYLANDTAHASLVLADGGSATADVRLTGNATLTGTVQDAAIDAGVDAATITVTNGSLTYTVDTGTAGNYTVDVAGNGTSYDVGARKPGYEHNDSAQTGLALADGATTTANATLTGNATLSGTLTDAVAGVAVENATVNATGGAGSYLNETDENGSFAITLPGTATYDVNASAAGYEPNVTFDVAVADAAAATLNRTLSGNASINGTVLANDSAALEEIAVTANHSTAIYPAETIENGSYTIEGVPGTAESYTVNATARAYRHNDTTVAVSGSVSDVNLTIDRRARYLALESLSAPATADEDESFTASVTVVNMGTENRTNESVTYSFDGSDVSSDSVDLNASNQTTVEFTHDYGTTGTYDHGIATVNESLDAEIEIQSVSGGGGGGPISPPDDDDEPTEPDVSVVGGSVSPSTVDVGATVDIVVTMQNDVAAAGDASVEIAANGDTIVTAQEPFAPDAQRELTYEHSFDEPGTYDVTVNGEAVGSVTVEAADQADDDDDESDDQAGNETVDDGGEDAADDGEDADDDGTPGFGILAAIAALLLAIGLRRRAA